MYGKAYRIISAIALILIGLVVSLSDKFYDRVYDYTFDFSEIRLLLGLPLLLIGLISLIYYSKQKKEKYEDKYLKCPSCYQVFKEKDVDNNTCINCISPLEPLDGFYDRHPEHKE